jgi:hypothetical protein
MIFIQSRVWNVDDHKQEDLSSETRFQHLLPVFIKAKQEYLTYGFYLIALTAGLFITIFVFAIVSSLFF